MRLEVNLYGQGNDWEADVPDEIVIFEDVKEVHRDATFFTVVKNNGDQHAVRMSKVSKFTLFNQE